MVKLLKSLNVNVATPATAAAAAGTSAKAVTKAVGTSVTDPSIRRNPEQARGRSMIMSVRHAADLLQVRVPHSVFLCYWVVGSLFLLFFCLLCGLHY